MDQERAFKELELNIEEEEKKNEWVHSAKAWESEGRSVHVEGGPIG